MKRIAIKTGLSFCLLLIIQQSRAQAPGSTETDQGLNIAGGGTTSSVAESIYIGPGTYQIDGSWEIYCKNVWISPDAVINGSGTIRFFNPSLAGGAASATMLDGNNNTAYIHVNIELNNTSGMMLLDLAKPADATTWTNSNGNANLNTGKDFRFGVAGAYVFIGPFDMVTATAATLTNYKPDRFVVTTRSGHLVHNNYTGSFVYPVGIATNDYTPAVVDNNTANTIHVMVQDTTASTAVETGIASIGHTWNIFADNALTAGGSMVKLQHNTASNQPGFNEAAHYVTQWGSMPNNTGDNTGSTTGWQHNTAAMPDLSPSDIQDPVAAIANTSLRQRTYGQNAANAFATTATGARAFFTKAGDAPDLTPTLDIDNLNFSGAGVNRDFVVNLFNIGPVSTNGSAIVFRINKLSSFTITYSATSGTSNVNGGTANENSNWTFSETANFITVTANTGVNIATNGQAVIGFHIAEHAGIPGNTSQNLTPAIAPGSGGEVKTDNNSVVTTVTAN